MGIAETGSQHGSQAAPLRLHRPSTPDTPSLASPQVQDGYITSDVSQSTSLMSPRTAANPSFHALPTSTPPVRKMPLNVEIPNEVTPDRYNPLSSRPTPTPKITLSANLDVPEMSMRGSGLSGGAPNLNAARGQRTWRPPSYLDNRNITDDDDGEDKSNGRLPSMRGVSSTGVNVVVSLPEHELRTPVCPEKDTLGYMIDSISSKAMSHQSEMSEAITSVEGQYVLSSPLQLGNLYSTDSLHYVKESPEPRPHRESEAVLNHSRVGAASLATHRRPHDAEPECTVTLSDKPPVKLQLPFMHKVKGAYRARTDWLRTYGLALLTIIFSVTLIGMLIMREFEASAVKNVKQTNKLHAAAAAKRPALPDIDWHNMTNTPTWNLSAWNGPAPVDPASLEWKGTIAICSIMKGENHADIEEWLLYHKWVGVDEVFLRENSNVVPPKLLQRLQPMIDSGFVHIDWLPGRKHPLQNRWYNRCSKPDMAGAHSWVAFVDLDEFLVPLEDGMAAQNPDLKKTLAHFKDYAAVSVQWVLFGSSGHVKRPTPGGPLRHYTKCTGEFSYQMKCLANMFWSTRETMMVGDTVHDCTLRMDPDGDLNSHPVVLTDGSKARMFENTHMGNPDGWDLIGRTRSYIGHLNETLYVDHRDIRPANKLAIFHYVTRSLSEYVSRKSKLPSGIYTHTFVTSHRHSHTSLMDLEAFAEFEKSFKFDQDHPVCHSVANAKYAERSRQAYEATVQQIV